MSTLHRKRPTGRQYSELDGQDELLNPEFFDTLLEARVLVERWRRVYDGVRPHSSLGYRPPAPEARLTRPPKSDPARDRTGEADS